MAVPRARRAAPGVRVIAGLARGRRLAVPRGERVRPTKDRVKAAVFSALDARDLVRDAVVLDLYAGSGALGIEALSRGAAAATFVERDRDAVAAIRANVAACGFTGVVVESDAAAYLRARIASRQAARSSGDTFDLAFVDPPYDMADEELRPVLAAVAQRAPGGLIVLERPRRWRRSRAAATPRAGVNRGVNRGIDRGIDRGIGPGVDRVDPRAEEASLAVADADLLPEWRTSWNRTFGDTLVTFWTPAAADDESRDTFTRPPARRGDG